MKHEPGSVRSERTKRSELPRIQMLHCEPMSNTSKEAVDLGRMSVNNGSWWTTDRKTPFLPVQS